MRSSKIVLTAILSICSTVLTNGHGLRKREWYKVSTPIHRETAEVEQNTIILGPGKFTSFESFKDAVAELSVYDLVDLSSEMNTDEKQSSSGEFNEANRDMQSDTSITFKNSCSSAIIIYFWPGQSLYIYGFSLLPGSESTYTSGGESFGIYAYSTSGSYQLSGDSDVCFSDGSCFKRESISGGNVMYPINCDESPSSSTTTTMTTTTTRTPTVTSTESNNEPSSTSTTAPATQDEGSDNEWLIQHNKRRKTYHAKYGKDYVPLTYSNTLEVKAQAWANELIARDGCGYPQLEHAQCNEYEYGGENLAVNEGSSKEPATPHNVLTRWTEDEDSVEKKPFPTNGHFTQVIWRATTEVGCANASKEMSPGYYCHVQVCRYLKRGNCNINANNFELKMLEDTSPCGAKTPAQYCPQN